MSRTDNFREMLLGEDAGVTDTGDVPTVLSGVPRIRTFGNKRRLKAVKQSTIAKSPKVSNVRESDDDSLIPDDAEKVSLYGSNDSEQSDDIQKKLEVNGIDEPLIDASYAVVAPDFTPGATSQADLDKVKKVASKPATPVTPASFMSPQADKPSSAMDTILGKTESVQHISESSSAVPEDEPSEQVKATMRRLQMMRLLGEF